MSLYSSISFGNVTPIGGAGAGETLVPGSLMSVRVEEDEMDLVLNFQGNFLGADADILSCRFQVNGAGAPALPLYGTTFLLADLQRAANFSLHVTLPKGEHKVGLLATTAAGDVVAVDGAAFACTFSATRVSSAATLAHGVGSKVQGIY